MAFSFGLNSGLNAILNAPYPFDLVDGNKRKDRIHKTQRPKAEKLGEKAR